MDSNKQFTIIEALDRVQAAARKSQLSESFWESCSNEFTYLSEQLDLTPQQILLVAILCEQGVSCSWKMLGSFLGLSRLKTMALTPALNGLLEKRWVFSCAVSEDYNRMKGFCIAQGVINELRNNRKFIPEKIDGLSEQDFVDRLYRYIRTEGDNESIPFEENIRWLMQYINLNLHLPMCQTMDKLADDASRIILMIAIVDYARCVGTGFEGVAIENLSEWFMSDIFKVDSIENSLRNGNHELFNIGLIEHRFDAGMINPGVIKLTEEAVTTLLGSYKPHNSHNSMKRDSDVQGFETIKPRPMFYNERESKQIERLKEILDDNKLSSIQDCLSQNGLRRGITCLFYGAPGTGKTESVFQLAHETQRDIVQVDIAGIRDKFVGESEKNIKSIFSRYRFLCQQSERTPILLFNEADAIINCRLERTGSSVEKMDNAIQNIILQEMEKFDGILVATTNLTSNLDKAFERRFLFKVEFSKPGVESKKKIWQSLLPELSEGDCRTLANDFDFSGGQIENIARKSQIECIISGESPTLEVLRRFCGEEILNRDNYPRVGF